MRQGETRSSGLELPKGVTMAKTWQCNKGHRRKGKPFRIAMTIEGEKVPVLTTAALCPVCVTALLEKQCRAREVV